MNINTINTHKEIYPLYTKAYSYEMGALSSNNEIRKAVLVVMHHIGGKGCWVFDRGADNQILKDFFLSQCLQAIIRLKRNTSLTQVQVNRLLRWSIKEYHRHVKQEYHLEAIQMKTFSGLQSILVLLTTAIYMINKKTQSLHLDLLLNSGYHYLVKHKVRELIQVIYCKISKVVCILLMPTKSKWTAMKKPPDQNLGQINLAFDQKKRVMTNYIEKMQNLYNHLQILYKAGEGYADIFGLRKRFMRVFNIYLF